MQLFDAFDYFGQRSRDLVEKILVARRGEQTFKSFDRTWSRLAAIHLLGCQPETFDQTRRALHIEPVRVGTRLEYTWSSIQAIRRQISPPRQSAALPIIGVMSGKGGCSKTTFSVLLAQRLVLDGNRVLVIDTDPQANATSLLLAVNPDVCFEADDTVAPFMMRRELSFHQRIVQTGMEGLDLVPCCQGASIMDLEGIKTQGESNIDVVNKFWSFRNEIIRLKDRYDVVIIDTPPTLTYTNIRSAIASNLLITPLAPSMNDICSSTGFENTMRDYLRDLLGIKNSMPQDIHARRFMVSQYEHNKTSHREHAKLIKTIYPGTYDAPFANLTEISNAGKNGNTVYDERSAINSSSTRKRALDQLDVLFSEVIADIEAISNPQTTIETREVAHG